MIMYLSPVEASAVLNAVRCQILELEDEFALDQAGALRLAEAKKALCQVLDRLAGISAEILY